MTTVLLLVVSNTFMTFAWYGHLKYRSVPVVTAVVVSWLIALTGCQLKIIQEAITLVVFAIFAYGYLGEPIRWNYLASFACLFGPVMFAFWGRL
jgi:uncharacterized protein (DUF486 family)